MTRTGSQLIRNMTMKKVKSPLQHQPKNYQEQRSEKTPNKPIITSFSNNFIFCKHLITKSVLMTCSVFSLTLSPSLHAAIAGPTAGDLIISEIMSNPGAVSDTLGEWFEIYNTSVNDIDLSGLTIKDNGSNSHIVSESQQLIIQSGEYFVFGRNQDTSINGHYIANYQYSNFTLGNSSDAIILDYFGLPISSIIYNQSIFGTAGNSIEWNGYQYDLTPEEYTYGDGDIGTPGLEGSQPLATVVPVPASAWLLFSAMSSLLFVKKKQQVSLRAR